MIAPGGRGRFIMPDTEITWRDRLRYWDEAFLMLSLGLFIHFYPILAAAPLSGPRAFERWMWFSTWP